MNRVSLIVLLPLLLMSANTPATEDVAPVFEKDPHRTHVGVFSGREKDNGS